MLEIPANNPTANAAKVKMQEVNGMIFSNAKRTDVLLDQNKNEIGWVYTTDEGERVLHYLNKNSQKTGNNGVVSEQTKHITSSNAL
jgi:hypothetical protein